MYSVVKTFLPILAVSALAAVSVTSCDSEAKREKAAAESLVAQAEILLQNKDFEGAFIIMDSVDQAFPQQIEARRTVTKMRSQAMGDYAEYQIYVADSIIAEIGDRVEEQSKTFKHIPGGDIPGYYVMSNVPRSDFMSSSGIEGRIDDETYRFYVVAVNSGEPIGIRQIAMVTKGDESAASESIPADSDRAGETGAGAIDLATFNLDEVELMMSWLADHAQDVDHALLMGIDGKKISYTPAQARALVSTWQFAEMASKLYQARLQREKSERQLIIARDHSVNL